MTRREKAVENFKAGYNCAQSVALAFDDMLDIDRDTLSRLVSSFGGGVSRLREVCGAVSGMAAVTGLLYGYAGPETGAPKAELYARVQALAKQFEEKNGAIVCRELMSLRQQHDDPTPTPRTQEFYHSRRCMDFVGDAAELMEELIERGGAIE